MQSLLLEVPGNKKKLGMTIEGFRERALRGSFEKCGEVVLWHCLVIEVYSLGFVQQTGAFSQVHHFAQFAEVFSAVSWHIRLYVTVGLR